MKIPTTPVVLSDEEAVELYRFTCNSYIDPNRLPALYRLVSRVTTRVEDVRPDVLGPR